MKKIIHIAMCLVTVVIVAGLISIPASAATTAAKPAPAAPELKFADWVTGGKVSVRWTRVKGAKGYCVYRSRTEDGRYKRIATVKGQKNLRTIVKEKRSQTGFYKVRAFKTVKKKRVYGDLSDAVECPTYKNSPLGYLFPSGPPKSQGAMRKYLVTVRVPIRTSGGGKRYISFPVHKKLKKRVKAAFNDMYKAGFKVQKQGTWSYNWRMMRTARLRSHHSYGCVIDISPKANPMVKNYWKSKGAYRPGKNRYSITPEVVEIWKKYGFYWGGDWTEKKDYMHMTFTNN